MRTAKIGYIAMSAVMCVLGIIVIVNPTLSASVLGILFGVALILFGAVKLVGYFSKDLYRLAFQYDLISGIILIAIGVIVLTKPQSFVNFICIALGIYIFTDGLLKVQIARDSKRFGLGRWWLILVLAAVTALCGLVLMFRPGEGTALLMTVIGINLLADGVLNLITVLTSVKIVKNQKPDVIEAEFKELK